MSDQLPVAAALDAAGADTLEVMSGAVRYSRWQFERIQPYLGRRICEVGSGIGNLSQLLLESPAKHVLLTDRDPFYLTRLHSKFHTNPRVSVEQLELPDTSAASRFASYRIDTIVAMNVLEHIYDDRATLRSVAGMIVPDGRIVLLVPALPSLFGSLDVALGHYRRYTPADIRRLFTAAGLELIALFYFNLLGAAGWFANSRLLRAERISRRQLECFDRLVPLLKCEDRLRLPLGQSLIAVGARPGGHAAGGGRS